jgi:hypothetical protein
MESLPYSSFDATMTNYFKSKNPMLFELLRFRYKYAFCSVIGSLTAGEIDDNKANIIFEEAIKETYFKALKGKFADLKSLEEYLSFGFLGYMVILQNCNEQVDFLELVKEFRKKIRFCLKKQFLIAFSENRRGVVAPEPSSYIFSFNDYFGGNFLAKLFVRGLFYEPLLCYTNSITNAPDEDKNIAEKVLDAQYLKREDHRSFTTMVNFFQNGCRTLAFEYLKDHYKDQPYLSFLFPKKRQKS